MGGSLTIQQWKSGILVSTPFGSFFMWQGEICNGPQKRKKMSAASFSTSQ
jgi:hypothetical protein